MSFKQLVNVSRICHSKGTYYGYIEEWNSKRDYLQVYLSDLPNLIKEYRNSRETPYENNPMIRLFDQIPRIRLSSTSEAAANCLYSMAEIAAQFASRVSTGQMPASFNKLRKKFEDSSLNSLGIQEFMNDFTWYKKVRELRTEWVHHSTTFIAETKEKEPFLIVRAFRRTSDQEEFSKQIEVQFTDLISWIRNAIETIDKFGDFLLVKYVIPSLDLNSPLITPIYDEKGFPKILPNHRFEVETITVEEYLRRYGITIQR